MPRLVDDDGTAGRRSPGLQVFMFLVVAWCAAIVAFNTFYSPGAGLILTAVAFTVTIVPYMLAVFTGMAVRTEPPRLRYRLLLRKGDPQRWAGVEDVVARTWTYERSRLEQTHTKIQLTATAFGAVPALILAATALLCERGAALDVIQRLAVSLAIAVFSSFFISMERLLVRISSHDFNARMFSWALRANVFAVLADLGLFLVLGEQVVATVSQATLLGVVTGILGDRAIPLLMDKAAALFGFEGQRRLVDSSLRDIEGMTDDDVDRLAEEGMISCHDLAFVPTARLFFNTTYSLQKLCDWQDQALLRVYMGSARAKALFDQVAIRGAIDLQGLAAFVLGIDTPLPARDEVTTTQRADDLAIISNESPERTAAQAERIPRPTKPGGGMRPVPRDGVKQALAKALALEGAALESALLMLGSDEVTMRLRVYWEAAAFLSDSSPPPERSEPTPEKRAAA